MKKIIRFDLFLLANASEGYTGHVHPINGAFWNVVKGLQNVSFANDGNVIRAETEEAVYVYVGEEKYDTVPSVG